MAGQRPRVLPRRRLRGGRRTTVSRRLKALAEKAGVPVIKLHEGRHSAASLARDAGVDDEIRQKTLGHADRNDDIALHRTSRPRRTGRPQNAVARVRRRRRDHDRPRPFCVHTGPGPGPCVHRRERRYRRSRWSAEGVGFEPTRTLTRSSGFQDRRHRPLGEPSRAPTLRRRPARRPGCAGAVRCKARRGHAKPSPTVAASRR